MSHNTHRFSSDRSLRSQIARLPDDGRSHMLHDGGGLYLAVRLGRRSWVYRYTRDGKPHTMGLGPYPDCGLTDARAKVAEARSLIHGKGIDPLQQKHQARQARLAEATRAITFGQCAAQYVESHASEWTNAKHADQWTSTIEAYAVPIIGALPIQAIETPQVLKVLQPIWQKKHVTAKRLRGRIEAVLDWAKVSGYRTGDNPARWRGHLEVLLGRSNGRQEHHAALSYRDLPGFMFRLRAEQSATARLLEWTILTCARAGESIGATWSEIDMEARTWTVPAERMKARREHRVPLCGRALTILKELSLAGSAPDAPVFPTVPQRAMLTLVNRLGGSGFTVHGFRSTFRDWCAEQTSYPREMPEIALAHTVGDAVERAYLRSDMFEKRRALADEWASHCASAA
jgi:integrase